MAFWSMTSSLSMAGATEKVLDRDSHDLKDLLDCDDILNQVLAPNDRVIRYLSQPDIIYELAALAVAPPPSKQVPQHKVHASKTTEEDEANADNDLISSEKDLSEVKSPDLSEDYQEVSNTNKEGREPEKMKTPVPSTNLGYESFSSNGESVEYREFQDVESVDSELDDDQDDAIEEERLKQIRYSKVCAEILTTDVWMLLDALLSNEKAMNRLWAVLETEEDATPQQLNLLTKIVESLLEKRLDRMLDFVRTLPRFVDYFIRYIECQPLVDFLIKVISTDHPESPTEIIDFLFDQDLIPKAIDLLSPTVSHSAQSAAGDFLKAFVNISGGNKSDICAIGPNELSRQFVGTECMSRLIDIMIQGGHGMCVAVTVIIEAIRKNNSDYDMVEVTDTTLDSHPPNPRDNIYLGTMVKLFADAIPKFQAMLIAPESKVMKMPFGEVKPLGFVRFRICELYAELLHCSNMNLLNDPSGERIIRERDLERNNIYFPGRKSSIENPTEETRRAHNQSKSAESHIILEGSLDNDTGDFAELAKPLEGDDDLSDSDSEDSPTPTGLSDLSQTAHAPHISSPSSPSEKIDSPPESPSPPTPENESGDDMEFVDDSRQKINVSNHRGKSLEDALERESRSLRRRAVVGDQLKFALDDNHCVDAVIQMLFEFPWNNFLHNVVFDIVQQVFNGYIDHSYNKFLAIHLFTRAHLTEQIVRGQRANEVHEQEKNIRLGYVGHLTLISEEVVKFGSLFVPESVHPDIVMALSDREWIEYVQNDLLQLREQYNTVLGKVNIVSEEEDSYEIQDDDDRRMLALELNLTDKNDNNFRKMGKSGGVDSESESESDSESDSDEEKSGLGDQSSSDEDVSKVASPENVSGTNKIAEKSKKTPDLKPTSSKLSSRRRSVKGKRSSKETEASPDPQADGWEDEPEGLVTDTSSHSDKIPKDASEFARYMSRQLNSDQFSSGSSEDEEEEVLAESASQNRTSEEQWVPIDENTESGL